MNNGYNSSGGSKGAQETPPPVQILSISCSFWEILAKSYVGAPPGSWRPLLGEILDPPLMTFNALSLHFFGSVRMAPR